jgi:uncharacterized pyridoxamine 5'-phosphate oxidase family protein
VKSSSLELVQTLLRSVPEAHFATVDGDQPRVRPVSIARVQGDRIWFASFRRWGKIAEIQVNPRSELSFVDTRGRHLRLTGTALLEEGAQIKRQVWDSFAMMQRYFPDPSDPGYALIEFRVERVRVKDAWELDYREVEPAELRVTTTPIIP